MDTKIEHSAMVGLLSEVLILRISTQLLEAKIKSFSFELNQQFSLHFAFFTSLASHCPPQGFMAQGGRYPLLQLSQASVQFMAVGSKGER